MDRVRWDRLQSIFHAAAAVPAGEQQTFVQDACAGDPLLAADVLAMLHEDAASTSLLDRGVAVAADQVLGTGALATPVHLFGPYRATRLLGEGGMGVVYLAARDDLGSVAAVKIGRFTEAQGAGHLNTGIAHVKLGRALVRQQRYAEAEGEILTGYGILSKQTSPTVSWIKNAREDLATVYDALKQPEKAAVYRAALAAK